MSRWRDRLIRKYANAKNAENAKTPFESPLEGSFGNFGKFGIGTFSEIEARDVARLVTAAGRAAAALSRPGAGSKRLELARELRQMATDLREIAAEIRARDILRHAELAAPRPDLDPAEWQGEYEADPAPGEVGDLGESEHDAWLAGVPIRKLEAASPVSSKTALESFDER
jgi:hypothetical protein